MATIQKRQSTMIKSKEEIIEEYADMLRQRARDWHKGQHVGMPQSSSQIGAQADGFIDGLNHVSQFPSQGLREALIEIDRSLYLGEDLNDKEILDWYIEVTKTIKKSIKEILETSTPYGSQGYDPEKEVNSHTDGEWQEDYSDYYKAKIKKLEAGSQGLREALEEIAKFEETDRYAVFRMKSIALEAIGKYTI